MYVIFELFFVTKIPVSRRVEYVINGSMDESVSQRAMYVCHTNQIGSSINSQSNSCCKGRWYVRRFDPDTVQDGHIYSSINEEEVFKYWVYFDIFCGLG